MASFAICSVADPATGRGVEKHGIYADPATGRGVEKHGIYADPATGGGEHLKNMKYMRIQLPGGIRKT